MSSIQIPNIFCLAPEWKKTTGLPLRINALTCFPWVLWTYCSFMDPCFAISLKTKEEYLGIRRVHLQDRCNCLSSKTSSWPVLGTSLVLLLLPLHVLNQLPTAPSPQTEGIFFICLCSQN